MATTSPTQTWRCWPRSWASWSWKRAPIRVMHTSGCAVTTPPQSHGKHEDHQNAPTRPPPPENYYGAPAQESSIAAGDTAHCRRQDSLGDVPSRSFGWKVAWHFENDAEFLTFFNPCFPLPNQNCWTGFRLTDKVSLKVMRKLLTQGSPVEEWRRLPTLRTKYGASGWPIASL